MPDPTRSETLEERLVGLHRAGASGALTVRDGQRIRTFFLRDGRLVQTASNLKKEAGEAVVARIPGLAPAALPQAQAGVRLAGALGAGSALVEWESGRAPSREQPVDLLRALADALAWGLDAADIRRRLVTRVGPGAPRAVAEAAPPGDHLPVPPELDAWIQTLDGRRPLSEALEFGPPDAAQGVRTLYFAALLGIVEFPSPEGTEVRAEGVAGSEAGVDERLTRVIAHGIPRPEPVGSSASDASEAAVRAEIQRIEAATTHHDVLGVPWDSSSEDIQKAFFAIARFLHPDRMTTADLDLLGRASTAFGRAREAWECFRDAGTRQAYLDRVVHGLRSEDELIQEKVQEILSMEALFRRGMTFFHAGQIVKARPCFEEVAQRVPEQAEFRVYLGYTLWRLERGRNPAEAARGRRMLEEALQAGGRDDAFVLLGRVCREEGDVEGAARAWARALASNPQNREALREVERVRQAQETRAGPGDLKGLLSRFLGGRKP